MSDDGRSGGDEESREGGEFSDEFEDDDLLEAVREHEPIGTTDVAEIVGCHRSTALRRLRALAEAGKVERKVVGPAQVWTVA